MIDARSLGVQAGAQSLLRDISLTLMPGEVLAVIGPNGAGKSTLLRALTGERAPDQGAVAMEGRRLAAWSPRALAQRRAVVSQSAALAFPLSVAQVVALGRLPWHGTAMMARDDAAVAAALAEAGIAHLARRSQATLSGGEKQRMHLARALAQLDGASPPAALLLDEPTASLDVKHGAALLALLRRLARRGLAVLVVLHDLNEAAYVADRVALLEGGRMVALGPAAQVLQPALLEQVYGVPFRAMEGALLPSFSA